MADTNHPIAALHWIAIDVARYWNAVLVETASGQRHRFRMTNSAADMQRLSDFLLGLGGRCRVALEPTGDYHRPIAYRLLRAGFEVVSISSVAQSRFREVMFNSWDKNDPKDAAVILEMLKQGRTQQYVDPMVAGHHDIQELSKTYYQISRARTKVQHAIINHHVPLYFPEMHKYWSSTRNEWWVKFMIEFPTPVHVRRHTCQEFIELASPVVGRRVHRVNKLTEIWESCADSGALPHDPQCIAVQTFLFTLRHYQYLNDMRRQLEEKAQSLLASDADYITLMSLPGVGPINALTILAEAGNLRRFGHHRQFLKYCGFDLAKSQSGVHRGREQLSKRGNARLGVLAGRRRRDSSSRELLSGEVRPIRQQQPQGPRPQAQGAHGRGSQDGTCGVWNDQEEPALPAVLRAEFAQRIDPSQQGRRGANLRLGTP